MSAMNDNASIVRRLYAARAAGDVAAAARLLADDVLWHEPGQFDYSGDHAGREAVLSLLTRLAEATGGSFALRPGEILTDARVRRDGYPLVGGAGG